MFWILAMLGCVDHVNAPNVGELCGEGWDRAVAVPGELVGERLADEPGEKTRVFRASDELEAVGFEPLRPVDFSTEWVVAVTFVHEEACAGTWDLADVEFGVDGDDLWVEQRVYQDDFSCRDDVPCADASWMQRFVAVEPFDGEANLCTWIQRTCDAGVL